MATAEEIVRLLAAIEDPTISDRDYAPSSECGLCDASDGPDYTHRLDDPEKHDATCPWRLARAWVAAHPGQQVT